MKPDIETQEREINELLQRVMRAPLQPLNESLDKMMLRLESLEEKVDDLLARTGATLSSTAKVMKTIADLDRSSNDLANDLTDTHFPILAGRLDHLEIVMKSESQPIELALRNCESRTGEALALLDNLTQRAGTQEALSRELSSSSEAQTREAGVAVTEQLRSTQHDLLRAIEQASQRMLEDAQATSRQRHSDLLLAMEGKLDRLQRISWLIASGAGLAALACLGLWARLATNG